MRIFPHFPAAAAAMLLAAALHAAAQGEPILELESSATNLVVCENFTLSASLLIPPLPEPYQNEPPFFRQRPPHLTAQFLERDWKNPIAERPSDLLAAPPRQNVAASFTLNKYVSDRLLSMPDPFEMLNDESIFGRDPFAPRPAQFPFAVSRIERGGTNFWRFTATTPPYRAAAPGKLAIPAVTAELPVVTALRNTLDRFGRTVPMPETRIATIASTPLEITIAAPPQANRPATYCGAIGRAVAATAALNRNVCTAGDPLTLTLDITGAANPAELTPPNFAKTTAAAGFRLDAASLKTQTLPDGRRFSWRVRPIQTGTIEFPSLPVSWFDAAARAYATISTPAIPIQVNAGVQAILGDPENGETDDAPRFPLPDGISLSPRGAAAEPLLPRLNTIAALFILPPALFFALRLIPPVRRQLNERAARARRAGAWRKCRRTLAAPRSTTGKKLAAIQKFFTDRYEINGKTITAADAKRLMAADFPAADIALVEAALAEADASAFAAKPARAALGAIALAAALLAPANANAAAPDRAAFAWRRANALATRAAQPEEFRAAAEAYAACLEAGAANPILLENLAACATMAGDHNRALAAYAAAERRTGATASTERGIRAANARRSANPLADPPPARTLFRPHVAFSLDARLFATALLWAALWAAALLPPGGLRRLLISLLAVAFVLAAISSAISLGAEHLAQGIIHARK